MLDKRNRFFHGFCLNTGNSKSNFQHFIIETVRPISDYSGRTITETINKMEDYYFDDDRIGNPFYMVYGTFKAQFNKSSMVIGTFDQLHSAIDLVENLTGNYVKETEQPVYRVPDQY
jgi:hypothetical protein